MVLLISLKFCKMKCEYFLVVRKILNQMSLCLIFCFYLFILSPQFPDSPLSFLMIFFSLSHSCHSSEESIQIRSLLFSHFFFSMKLTHSYHFKEDNLSSLNLSHEPQTSIANSELCYVPASNDMLVSVWQLALYGKNVPMGTTSRGVNTPTISVSSPWHHWM